METKRTVVPAAEEILGLYYPCLPPNGYVALKSYMDSDVDIEAAARVSYAFGTRKTSETRGLIRYLQRHRHSSPLEMVELKFHMIMPIFVARQIIRHRTANVNEQSGRYSLLPMLFYTPEEENFKAQSQANKQGRDGELSSEVYTHAVENWNLSRAHATELYTDLAEAEVARELARIDLPLSTYTQWYWKIDLHNLFHFLTLRCDSHAQYECRVFANAMAGMAKRLAPLAFEGWQDYGLGSHTFSRQEMDLLVHCAMEGVSPLSLTDEEMSVHYKMNKREIADFKKTMETESNIPSFDIDLDEFVHPDIVEQKLLAAVPKVEVKNG